MAKGKGCLPARRAGLSPLFSAALGVFVESMDVPAWAAAVTAKGVPSYPCMRSPCPSQKWRKLGGKLLEKGLPCSSVMGDRVPTAFRGTSAGFLSVCSPHLPDSLVPQSSVSLEPVIQ